MTKIKDKMFIAVFLTNILLIILSILALELVFGDWTHPDNLNKLNILRSRKIRYNTEGVFDSPAKIAIYTRDRYGLRGSFAKPNEIIILTVGGSTTDQRYITDGQTWQDVLQQQFQSAGKKVVVGNAGIDGQSTVGHIKNFDWWFNKVPGLTPKYILFYVGLNDFYVENSYDTLIQKESFYNSLRERSALYHSFRVLYGSYLAMYKYHLGHQSGNFPRSGWTTIPLQDDYDRLMAKRLNEYANRLNILITKTKAFGSVPIFVTQPSLNYRFNNGKIEGRNYQILYEGVPINGVDYYHMIRKLNKLTFAVCKKNNILCVDMAGETTWEDSDFYDFVHMTPRGAKKVGAYLFKKLSQLRG